MYGLPCLSMLLVVYSVWCSVYGSFLFPSHAYRFGPWRRLNLICKFMYYFLEIGTACVRMDNVQADTGHVLTRV